MEQIQYQSVLNDPEENQRILIKGIFLLVILSIDGAEQSTNQRRTIRRKAWMKRDND